MDSESVLAYSDGETKCPGCNYSVVSRYHLESESEERAVCGDCFSNWLINTGAQITL